MIYHENPNILALQETHGAGRIYVSWQYKSPHKLMLVCTRRFAEREHVTLTILGFGSLGMVFPPHAVGTEMTFELIDEHGRTSEPSMLIVK